MADECYSDKVNEAVQFRCGWSTDCHLLQAYESKYLVLRICFYILDVEVLNAQIMYQAGNKQDITLGDFKWLLVEISLEELFLLGYLVKECSSTFSEHLFHHPVKTAPHTNYKVPIYQVETVYKCGICQVQMCPVPSSFKQNQTLQEYLFYTESNAAMV